MPNLRDIHQVGWSLVSMLWLQASYKAKEFEIQGKAARQSKKDGSGQANSGSLEVKASRAGNGERDRSIKQRGDPLG